MTATPEPLDAQLLSLVIRMGRACASPDELDELARELEQYAEGHRRAAALWRKVGTGRFTSRPNAVHIEGESP